MGRLVSRTELHPPVALGYRGNPRLKRRKGTASRFYLWWVRKAASQGRRFLLARAWETRPVFGHSQMRCILRGSQGNIFVQMGLAVRQISHEGPSALRGRRSFSPGKDEFQESLILTLNPQPSTLNPSPASA